MIPDKIYIRHYWMPGELDDDWRLKPVGDEQYEEYIRKETLLEWLEKKVQLSYGVATDALVEVIEKVKAL